MRKKRKKTIAQRAHRKGKIEVVQGGSRRSKTVHSVSSSFFVSPLSPSVHTQRPHSCFVAHLHIRTFTSGVKKKRRKDGKRLGEREGRKRKKKRQSKKENKKKSKSELQLLAALTFFSPPFSQPSSPLPLLPRRAETHSPFFLNCFFIDSSFSFHFTRRLKKVTATKSHTE